MGSKGNIERKRVNNLIPDYLLEEPSISKDTYVTKGQFCYSKKLHSTMTSVEALFSKHRAADQKITKHVLFAISPESSVCIVSDDTNIYILFISLLFIPYYI